MRTRNGGHPTRRRRRSAPGLNDAPRLICRPAKGTDVFGLGKRTKECCRQVELFVKQADGWTMRGQDRTWLESDRGLNFAGYCPLA
jgi:hypothetical protein